MHFGGHEYNASERRSAATGVKENTPASGPSRTVGAPKVVISSGTVNGVKSGALRSGVKDVTNNMSRPTSAIVKSKYN